MRLFKFLMYGAVALGLIFIWESYRDKALPIISSSGIDDSSKIITESYDLKKTDESVKKGEEKTTEQEKVLKSEETKESKKENASFDNNSLLSFEKGFAEIAKRAMHSVVNVATLQLINQDSSMMQDEMGEIFRGSPFEDMLRDFFGGTGIQQKPKKVHALGSGFIVKVDENKNKAYIVTNNHVVEKAKKIVVFLSDKTELPAEVHASDQRTDISILSVDTKILGKNISKLVPVKWGSSDILEEGNWVIAIGNPFGLGSTVTQGIVSGKGRNIGSVGKSSSLGLIDNYIQHSAPINMGNSGGCLLNIKGEVIGINNAIFSTSGGNMGIGFAIPSDVAKNVVDQLITDKRTYRGWFGAEVHLVTSKHAQSVGIPTDSDSNKDSSKVIGAFVSKVVPNGPADKAGIKAGDIILSFGGVSISERNVLPKIVGNTKIGSKQDAEIWRPNEDGKYVKMKISVTVGDFEKAMESGTLDSLEYEPGKEEKSPAEITVDEIGVCVSKIPPQLKVSIPEQLHNHVMVTRVFDSSSMFDNMFVEGDIIIKADGKKITSPAGLKDVINSIGKNEAKKNMPVSFVISRGGFMYMLAVTIDFDVKKSEKKKEK